MLQALAVFKDFGVLLGKKIHQDSGDERQISTIYIYLYKYTGYIMLYYYCHHCISVVARG